MHCDERSVRATVHIRAFYVAGLHPALSCSMGRPPQCADAQPSDPWFARLAFHPLRKHGPAWVTVWLLMILGSLILLGAVAGPWVPGVIASVGGLVAGGRTMINWRRDSAHQPATPGTDHNAVAEH